MAGGGALPSSHPKATGSEHDLALTPGESPSASLGSSSCSSRIASRPTSTSGSSTSRCHPRPASPGCSRSSPSPAPTAPRSCSSSRRSSRGAAPCSSTSSARARSRSRRHRPVPPGLRRHRGRRLLVDVLPVDVGIPVPSLAARRRHGPRGAPLPRPLVPAPLLPRVHARGGLPRHRRQGALLSVLASLLIGWGSAAAVRLVDGHPLGAARAPRWSPRWSRELGIDVRSVAPTVAQSVGCRAVRRRGDDGAPLRVSVYGRDARDAELRVHVRPADRLPRRGHGAVRHAAPAGRARGLRDAARTRRARGGRTEVLAAGCAGPSRDGVVVIRRPDGTPLARPARRRRRRSTGGVAEHLLAAVAALGRAVPLARLDRP